MNALSETGIHELVNSVSLMPIRRALAKRVLAEMRVGASSDMYVATPKTRPSLSTIGLPLLPSTNSADTSISAGPDPRTLPDISVMTFAPLLFP